LNPSYIQLNTTKAERSFFFFFLSRRPALPPPKLMMKYIDPEKRGYLAGLKPGDVVRPHEHPPHVDLNSRNPNATSHVKTVPWVTPGEEKE